MITNVWIPQNFNYSDDLTVFKLVLVIFLIILLPNYKSLK